MFPSCNCSSGTSCQTYVRRHPPKDGRRLHLRELLAPGDGVKQVSPLAQLRDDVHAGGLDHQLTQTHHVGVEAQGEQHLHLCSQLADVLLALGAGEEGKKGGMGGWREGECRGMFEVLSYPRAFLRMEILFSALGE